MSRFDPFEEIARRRAEGRPFCVATVARTADVTSAKAGAKAVIDAEGRIAGFLGGGCVQAAARKAAAEALAAGRARLIRVKPAEQVTSLTDADGAPLYKSGCPSGGTVDILIEPWTPPMTLAVLGAGPVAEALARQARLMGWRVLHAAAAEDLGRIEADAQAPDFDLAAAGLGEGDAAVVAAQGKRDLAALRAAVLSPCGHVAMVASARKARALVGKLHAEGVAEAATARLRSPAGLDLGGLDPEEIALSVAAEIVQRRARARAAAAA
jgi:xanthine dehydrogenase accessory factor